MVSLVTLDLSTNVITGQIPTEIGLLADTLRELVLFENQMTGEGCSIVRCTTCHCTLRLL
jgi:hypothetical protein